MAEVKTIETRPIDALRPHPMQDRLFRPLEGEKFDALVVDLKANGQIHPILVLPDGTVVDGHQRLRAARRLGWAEVRVEVRHDLADDPAAVERLMMTSNLARKQLDSLDQARVTCRLLEVSRKRPPCGYDLTLLTKKLARDLSLSERHAKRLVNIARLAPMDVQEAVSAGRLSLVLADRFTRLTKAARERVVGEIRAGGESARVVAAALTRTGPKPATLARTYGKMMAAMAAGLDTIEGHESEIGRAVSDCDADLRTISRLIGFGEKMIALLTEQKAEAGRAIRAIKRLRSRHDRRQGAT